MSHNVCDEDHDNLVLKEKQKETYKMGVKVYHEHHHGRDGGCDRLNKNKIQALKLVTGIVGLLQTSSRAR